MPRLRDGLIFYFEAFRALRFDGEGAFGAGRIPWTSIERYAARHNLDNDELDTLEGHLRAMEDAKAQLSSGKETPTNGR
jgi:hypothetical protein